MTVTNNLRGTPSAAKTGTTVKEVSRFTDSNHITHVRMQEYYLNYPIWNAHAVVHTPQTKTMRADLPRMLNENAVPKTMNGQIYQKLEADLAQTPSSVFTPAQAERAKQFAIDAYQAKHSTVKNVTIQNANVKLLVFMDKQNTAHWVYHVEFFIPMASTGSLPANPIYILDAVNFKIYKTWDDVKTILGGGMGGNKQGGMLHYDNLPNHLAAFEVTREANTCYLKNDESVIVNYATNAVMNYPCEKPDATHNMTYWSGNFDQVNGGYSPANDALFAAQLIKKFYRTYKVPVLVNQDGSEMVLRMNVHVPNMDNAFWSRNQMTFGDGQEMYPLTSLGIAAHEVSHGFTEQHAGLIYDGQSGGMNEAFSDMAAKAMEYYVYHKNNWLLGGEVFKIENEALRYMDQPSKDCYGKEPGSHCSLDTADQYYEGINVHYSSGVYNRAFYLLSTTSGWDPTKAFAVMVQANASYWLPETQFADGAACAVKAAGDLGLDQKAVFNAFKTVGIAVPERCTNN